MSLKRKVKFRMTPTQSAWFKITGKYNNRWGDLKFVIAEKQGKVAWVFYDPKVKV